MGGAREDVLNGLEAQAREMAELNRLKVIGFAASPQALESVFEDILAHHGLELAMRSYVEALFAPHSIIRRYAQGMLPPEALQREGAALAQHFLKRLRRTRAKGEWFEYCEGVSEPYAFILRHLSVPADVAELHLGSRDRITSVSGGQMWFGHPAEPVQYHLRDHPPAPGELGPMLAPLLRRLDNGQPPALNLFTAGFESALALVHQFYPNPQHFLRKSVLSLLGDKRYCQDYLFPVDTDTCVHDHIPRLLEHIDVVCEHTGASPDARQAWYETLQALRTKIDRNRERVMAQRWGQPADPAAERVPSLIGRDDVL